jgi:hypothetical protein
MHERGQKLRMEGRWSWVGSGNMSTEERDKVFFSHFLDIGERSVHYFHFKILVKHLLAFRGKFFLGVEMYFI